MKSHTIDNFIDSIHRSHLDNAQNVYMANKIGRHGDPHSVSPLTNFVFEYFLFNSLYSIDWSASMESDNLIAHSESPTDVSESKQQREFVKFCRKQFKKLDSNKITEAFLPLARLNDFSGDWTTVSPDDRITVEEGKQFFERIAQLGERAEQDAFVANQKTFKLIDNCCHFVYLVRNNIFHGAKSIGDIYESDQARRIGVYDLFVRCLNSLFFLSCGRKKHGAALAQLPIVQNIGDATIDLTIQDVYGLLRQNWLKPEDSVLHWNLFRNGVTTTQADVSTKRALFYPSAGQDILFPLIVGLPYCTDFYFYEKSNRESSRKIPIEQIRQISRTLNVTIQTMDSGESDCGCYEFEFDSTLRRIWKMQRDNTAFLDLTIPLSFFFHRGDSQGEGGSDQQWDSEFLLHLLKRASTDVGLRILTDGEPGGLDDSVKSKLKQISPPNSHRNRDYFYGVLRGTSSEKVQKEAHEE